MQTFLPYPDFTKSARCLDNKRLFKQCVECKQLLLGQYPKHPASKMWFGYENALAEYGKVMAEEAIKRGINAAGLLSFFIKSSDSKNNSLPFWLGNELFHSSHRSNLLRKDYDFYSKYGWTETTSLPYYWPVQ